MTKVCFNIINTIAPLDDLHRLSDAGLGAGLMRLTPARDSEIILYGRPLTLSGEHGLLSNGAVSPAVLVHGLFRLLHRHGIELEFRSFNFGVPLPKTTNQPVPWLISHYGGEQADTAALSQQLLDCLLQQQADYCLLAECGVGGTIMASLWLSGLAGTSLQLPSSTLQSQKLVSRQRRLAELDKQHLSAGFELARMLTEPDAHDPLQWALCHLLTHWPSVRPLPILAGGIMLLAPLLACQPQTGRCPTQFATTQWLWRSPQVQQQFALAFDCKVQLPTVDFYQSRHNALHRYEQGQVVEGCGLGAMLWLSQHLGCSDSQIMTALDAATEHYLHGEFDETI
ncbi:hypothetical protein [Ferrimonas senticii]|uniref:hypothetical protein n=1 Tax=Ferrimonas senticii TaxID=394566 RepID=UPI00041904D0|nr:hypothetical protein [Ferrimonas senticii]